MAVNILIPTALRPQADNQSECQFSGASVREVLDALSTKHPQLGQRLFKSPAELNRFINIYVNDEDIRFMDNLDTALKDGDELSIVPAIAGGCTGGKGWA